MSFEQLIQKVEQCEQALESSERTAAANMRQLKLSFRASWTPARIVTMGLASGFLVGKARPERIASGGGLLQMVTALSGLFASGSAQAAAEEASSAATSATVAAAVADPVMENDAGIQAASAAREEHDRRLAAAMQVQHAPREVGNGL